MPVVLRLQEVSVQAKGTGSGDLAKVVVQLLNADGIRVVGEATQLEKGKIKRCENIVS